MQTNKTYREKSQRSLGTKPTSIYHTGYVTSVETLQCECVAQPRERCEYPTEEEVPSRRSLAQPGWWVSAAWHCTSVVAVVILQEQAAKFWLSTRRCNGAVLGHRIPLSKCHWGHWDSCAPLDRARVPTSLCYLERHFLHLLAGGEGLDAARGSWAQGAAFAYWSHNIRCWKAGFHVAPSVSHTGAHQLCLLLQRWARLSQSLFTFFHFQWGEQME